MRSAEKAAFDRRLTTNAHEVFRDVENFEGGPVTNRPAFREILVPLSLRSHLVEVTDEKGTLLYCSSHLRDLFPKDGIMKFHNHRIAGSRVW